MAENRELQILITAKDEASKSLNGIKSSLGNAEGASKAFGVGLLAVGASVVGFGAMAVKAAQESEFANKRLETIARQVTGATDEQIQSYKDLATQLQKVGVVEDDTIIAGQSQLSSFTKNANSVKILTSSMGDLMVAQNGINVTQEQAIGTANLMGKALSGQLGALTKTGVLVSGEYKTAFESANNEEERAIVLNKIIQDNYGGLNKAMKETSEGGLQALKNNFGDFMEVVGNKIIPFINQLVLKLNDFVSNTLPLLITKFQEVVGWFEKNQWAIYAIAGAIVGALVPAIYAMVVAFASAAIALAPFIIGGAIIGGIIAGIVWVVKNWDMLSAKAMEIFGAIAQFFVGIWQNISSVITGVWTAIADFFKAIWEGIKVVFEFSIAFIVGLVVAIFGAMGIDIVAVFQTISAGLTMFWENLKLDFNASLLFIQTLWNNIWNGVANFIAPLWEKIKLTISTGWAWIKNIFAVATQPLIDAWNGLWNMISGTVGNVWEGIKNTIKAGINWVLAKINYIIQKANDVASLGKVVGFTPPRIPDIPYLANGGIVTRPTLAMIGEAGAEAVIPLNKMNSMGGGISIVINGDVSGEELVEKVSNAIMGNLRNNTQLAF